MQRPPPPSAPLLSPRRWPGLLALFSGLWVGSGVLLLALGPRWVGALQILFGGALWWVARGLARQEEAMLRELIRRRDEERTRSFALEQQAALLEAQARELEEARDDALQAVRSKDQFLASMSHELRTPLNAVIGLSDLLVDTRLEPQQREYIEIISKSSHTLLDLIGDILDMSKLEAGRLEPEARPFEVSACVEDALDLVAAQAHHKGLSLVLRVGPDVPLRIVSDLARLRQVLVNLLSNAVKFTAQGSVSVRVQGRPLGAHVELRFDVSDSGIGIPADRMDRLFQPFVQVDASTTREYGGTGLGLAISRALVELLGGKIWVDSQPGKGATFSFTILAPIEPSDPWEPFLGQRVLVVDTDRASCEATVELFQALGATAKAASSEVEALRLLREDALAFCIVDLASCNPEGKPLLHLVQPRLPRTTRVLAMVSRAARGPDVQHKAQGITLLPKPLGRAALARFLTQEEAALPLPLQQEIPPPSSSLRALIVEDNAINRRVLHKMIERLGHQAEAVDNGEQALETLTRRPGQFQLVLLDVNMPGMDGYEVARRIREDLKGPLRPWVVGATANALPGDREKCINAGMDDYLSKPIELAALSNIVAALSSSAMPTGFTTQGAVSIIDLSLIHDAKRKQGEERIRALLSSFLEESGERFNTLLQAIERQEWARCQDQAQLISDAASQIGAVQLTSLLLGVGILLREQRHDELLDLIPELNRIFSRTVQALARVVAAPNLGARMAR
ncbi:MAG: ATP-binding protein [Polyangiaceae bacterium]|jgi:signal transduction histidine kinase/DNA-binding response OmpR family regulator|nr:ATP-binding protein [Polyangiaceae bacterium]